MARLPKMVGSLLLAVFQITLVAVTAGFITFSQSLTLTALVKPTLRSSRVASSALHSSSEGDWMESLRVRQQELQTEQFEMEQKWRNADCESGVKVELPDWIRRMDVGNYPLAACGSAAGTIYCVNIETGKILAQSSQSSAMLRDIDEETTPLRGMQETLSLLYGPYDGGGTMAVAMHENLICASGRNGSVQIYRLDSSCQDLISQGTVQALEGIIVTCLELDEDFLWVASADGKLQAFSHSSLDAPLTLQREPFYQWKFSGAIVSLSLNSEIGFGVCSTASGSVEIFSMDDDDVRAVSWLPPFKRNTIAQSAIIGRRKDSYSIFCGGSDGSLYIQPLNYDSTTCALDGARPLGNKVDKCSPSHLEAVKCIANPSSDIIVTGGADGTLRVWDLSEDKPVSLYQFIGYKVWLGSIWTDGVRLVSDGSDNSIVLHDFEKDAPSQE